MSYENEENLYGDNMENIKDLSENVEPNKWYHVRVDKVKTHDEKGEQMLSKTSKAPICQLNLKIQDEPYMGKVLVSQPSLQTHALFTLKAFYKAANYVPPPTGHNPHKLLNAEFYVKPTEKMYEGEMRTEIQSHNIKALSEGRPLK